VCVFVCACVCLCVHVNREKLTRLCASFNYSFDNLGGDYWTCCSEYRYSPCSCTDCSANGYRVHIDCSPPSGGRRRLQSDSTNITGIFLGYNNLSGILTQAMISDFSHIQNGVDLSGNPLLSTGSACILLPLYCGSESCNFSGLPICTASPSRSPTLGPNVLASTFAPNNGGGGSDNTTTIIVVVVVVLLVLLALILFAVWWRRKRKENDSTQRAQSPPPQPKAGSARRMAAASPPSQLNTFVDDDLVVLADVPAMGPLAQKASQQTVPPVEKARFVACCPFLVTRFPHYYFADPNCFETTLSDRAAHRTFPSCAARQFLRLRRISR